MKNLKNISSLLSVAGVWVPTGASDPVNHYAISTVGPFYSKIILPDGSIGLIFNGWAVGGNIHYSVNVAIFEQRADGVMFDSTHKYLSDTTTNGSASVVVVDINKDGKQDFILLAHNESPLIEFSSTAYIANLSGSFDKIKISDSLAAPHAISYEYNGKPSIFSATNIGNQASYYQYVNGSFVRTGFVGEIFGVSNTSGMSVALADFNNDGKLDVVISDAVYGLGRPYIQGSTPLIEIATLSDLQNNTGVAQAWLTPYFNNKSQFANVPSDSGLGLTHVPRVWVDDFNHDGKPDILASALMWSAKLGMEYAQLQMFQNTTIAGSATFKDVTDTLNKDYDINTVEVDKSTQILDFDGSGINSYFISSVTQSDSQGNPKDYMSANYILLNDGTGRIHVYMHDEFQNLGAQTIDFLNQYIADNGVRTNGPVRGQPRMIEVPTADGKINIAAVSGVWINNNGNWIEEEIVVNLPLGLDPKTDFTQNVTISDRNNSMLMRTWAGTDSFYDLNANSAPAHIDGGLGIDISNYSGAAKDYKINALGSSGFEVKKIATSGSASAIDDTLVNVERLKFSDKSIAMDVAGNAGSTAKILGAVFGKDSVQNKKYVGIGLDLLDKGMSYSDLAGLAVNAAGLTTNDQIVSTLWKNVVGTTASATDKEPFIDMLVHGMSVGDLAKLAADTSLNTTNIDLVGLATTGIEYLPVA